MKKMYATPHAEQMSLMSADVITMSVAILGEEDWDGKNINDLEFK